MVDRPVDNRLDKLEFAIAMHLIVCISKKGLPPPQGGALPNSLVALKAATSQGTGVTPSTTPASPPRVSIPEPAAPSSPMPSPSPQQMMMMMQQQQHQQHQQQQQQQQQQQSHMHPPRQYQPPHVETVEETPMVGPPPVVPNGGMSISDAFEGLSLTSELPPAPQEQYHSSALPVEPRSLPSYVPEVPRSNPVMTSPAPPISPQPSSYSHPQSSTYREYQPSPVPASTSIPSSASYDLGDAHTELDKLKSVLQKLQAENISLKAQLGNLSGDEKEVQKELGAVVAEIGKLSSELSMQRQLVLDAKNRLLEASAELKAENEHKR